MKSTYLSIGNTRRAAFLILAADEHGEIKKLRRKKVAKKF